MTSQIFSGMAISNVTKVILLAALTTVTLAIGGAAIGAADTEQMANESVTFDESSNVTVSADWNESADSTAEASVTFYNATEYESDPATATTVVTDTIASEPGNTTETEYTSADGLEDGTEYQLVVEADDTQADEVSVDTGGWGIGVIGSGGAGGGLFVAAALVGGGWFAKKEDMI